MIDPHCSPEVEACIAYLNTTGVPHILTSTIRPGAITISGNASLHSVGLACDFAGPHPSVDSQALADIFHAFGPVESTLAELIYAGPQVSYNIKNGKRVGKYAQSIHHNHVHVGLHRGQLLNFTAPLVLTIDPVGPAPTDHEEEDMAEPVSALHAPGRPDQDVWVLTKDGGVRAYGAAPFFGSYPGLPEQDRQGVRTFVDMTPSGDGYELHGSDGSVYRFGP